MISTIARGSASTCSGVSRRGRSRALVQWAVVTLPRPDHADAGEDRTFDSELHSSFVLERERKAHHVAVVV